MPTEERLRELIREATVDCYDEEEQFWGIWNMLEELDYPMSAILIGETVELIGLDGEASSSHRGIVALVRYKGQSYSVSLADLHIPDPSCHNAEWLDAYRYWLRF